MQARVTQGNTVIYSVTNLIYVDSASDTSVTLTAPLNGANVAAGVPLTMSATVAGSGVSSVQFYKNGVALGAGTNSGGVWNYTWVSPIAGGPYLITARAYDANSVQIAESAAVTINVGGATGGASDPTPIAVTVAPPPYSPATDVGTLPGSLSVEKDGSSSYSIPLVVPPGSAGMAPNLSLNYSSAGANGLPGLGWSIGGLSSIHRCGKTIAQDGVNDRIAFAPTDRLCLDGQRLILVNLALNDANYWADNAEYRTELEQYARITAKGAATANTRSFKVETKDGRVSTYGSTESSFVSAVVGPIENGVDLTGAPMPQRAAKSGPLSWAVDSVADRSGNYVKFSYEQDSVTGEHRPTFIRYGGAKLASHAAVALTYKGRPDAWKRYVDEARNDLRSVIDHIRTYVAPDNANLDGDVVASGTIVRDYSLQYEQSPTSGRSLLASVEVQARDPATSFMLTLPKTTFAWGKPDPAKPAGFQSMGKWNGAPILTTVGYGPDVDMAGTKFMHVYNHSAYFSFLDFENHGRTDILEKRVANAYPDDKLAGNIREATFNPIVPGTLRKEYRYFHNNGTGFDQYTYQLNTNEFFAVLEIGDFNGDGAPDLLVGTSNVAWTTFTNNIVPKICLSPLGAGVPALGTIIKFNCAASSVYPARGNNTVGGIPYVADVIGDGRAAHYGGTKVGAGQLCIQSKCIVDPNYPADVVGEAKTMYNIPVYPERTFIAFQDMIDFAGTGKTNAVRWSQADLQHEEQDDTHPADIHVWHNLQPRITVNTFIPPGVAIAGGLFASYNYRPYAEPPMGAWRMPYRFEIPYGGARLTGDFNGTGYNSTVVGFMAMDPSSQAPFTRAETTVCLSTGRGLDCGVRAKYSGINKYNGIRAVGNFIGDGQPSILVETLDFSIPDGLNHVPAAPTGKLQMCRLMGDSTISSAISNDTNMVCEPWSMVNKDGVAILFPHDRFNNATMRRDRNVGVPITEDDPTNPIDHVYYMDLLGTGSTQLVYYHSGSPSADGKTWDDSGAWWEVFAPRDRAVEGQALDRMVAVTNGLGAVQSAEYADGLNSKVVSLTGADADQLAYPARLAPRTGKIVSKIRVSNGVAADRTVSYRYLNPGTDLQGRGSLGFGIVTSTDDQTQISTTTRYSQTWPYTGMVSNSKTTAKNGIVLSETKYQLSLNSITKTTGAVTLFPYVGSSTVTETDLNGVNSSPTRTVTTVNAYTDGWGNLNSQTVTGVNGGTGIAAGTQKFTAKVTTFFDNTEANWLLGRPFNTTVVKSNATTVGVTRVTAFSNDPVTGLRATETVEPNTQSLLLKTTYGRNAFGLVETKTTNWTDPVDLATTSRVDKTVYDANGRYPSELTTAVSSDVEQKEQHTYDPATGAKTSLTGPNA